MQSPSAEVWEVMKHQHLRHILRMEKVIAHTRLGVVLLTGVVLLNDPARVLGSVTWMLAIWGMALAYSAAVVVAEPYKRIPLIPWEVLSGVVDWGLITLGIVATGGAHSDLYTLYFISVLSVALRFGLREVVIAGVGTAIGYFAIVMATATVWPQALQDAALRMGYLILVALGSGALARESNRQFRARVREEAQRLAVQEVTATVSHDLTNPLTAVTGLVEILLDSATETLSMDQRGLLHRVNANVQQMTNLVSNLRDADLIERGRQAFQPAPIDLNALVRRVVEAQSHQAELKHIGLVLDLSAPLPLPMLDGRMVERLVANLLGNAVKFTPENGAIRVSTRQRESRVAVEVWNSGQQVPAPLRRVLFEKFVRGKDGAGVGLGLYICRSIVDIHRGKIFFRNAPDDGVTFIAELPVVLPGTIPLHASESAAVPTPPKRGWRAQHALATLRD